MNTPDTPPAIVWFREDLRLADNPALREAARTGAALVCVYIADPDAMPGAAARWWLDGGLRALDRDLHALGGRLVVLDGTAQACLTHLIKRTGARQVFWNRRYSPPGRQSDDAIEDALSRADIAVHTFNGSLLYEPGDVRTKAGEPFRVYGAWWRAARQAGGPGRPIAAPDTLTFAAVPHDLEGHVPSIDALGLTPRHPDWAGGLREAWAPGEAAAHDRLDHFLAEGLRDYARGRDLPAEDGTSRLSAALHVGHLSARQVWHAAHAAVHGRHGGASGRDLEKFLAELGWRDFAAAQLFDAPDLVERNHRPEYDAIGWRDDDDAFDAWAKGRTGYPIVDAGMRQLWTTGWMHNRVRMVVASFLTKHLLIDWRRGERWFRDTLVDANIASNVVNWQWVAGCGVDAAPYFRIMNPVLQGEKFDPDGRYIRAWVPELADLPDSVIHAPWSATAMECERHKVRLGRDYPEPIVDHKAARQRALECFERVKRRQREG